MELNFAAFLEEYVPVLPDSLQDGILQRMTYSENLTKISFYVHFPHLVLAQDLLALEHELEIRLEIHSVRLHPRFAPELSRWSTCRSGGLLKREMTVVNGLSMMLMFYGRGHAAHYPAQRRIRHSGEVPCGGLFSGMLEQMFSRRFHVMFTALPA